MNQTVLNVLEDEVLALNSPAPLAGLLKGLLAESREPVLTRQERTELKKFQSQFDALLARLQDFGDERVKPEFLRRRNHLISSGKAEEAVVVDRESVRREFLGKRQALKAGLLEISNQARPICQEVLSRLVARAAVVADQIEAGERAVALRFGARHALSPACRGLRRLPELVNHLCGGGMSSPLGMLQGIVTEF